MTRTKRYLIAMVLVSLIGFSGTFTISIYSLGTLSFLALFLFAWVLTSLPMLFLLRKDITAIRTEGVDWARSRYFIYVLAVIFPSYLMTPAYWFVSHRKITKFEAV